MRIMPRPLELLFGVAKVIKLRIIPTSASNLRRVKPEALVARVLPAEQLKRMKAGDVSGLLDRDGSYLVPKKALGPLLASDEGRAPVALPGASTTGLLPESSSGDPSALTLSGSGGSDSNQLQLLETVAAVRLTDVIDQPGDEDMLSCEDRSFAPADAHAMEQARGVPTAARTMTDSESRLFQAVEEGDATTVRRLLSTGGQASTAARHPSHGGTVLHVAAGLVTLPVETQLEVMRALLEAGVDVQARSDNGATALHWAAGNGRVGAVELLLTSGADPHLTTYTWAKQIFGKGSGQTAAHWAAESGHADCIQALAGFGPVSVVLRDERGQDPRALAQKELRFDCDALLQGLQEEEYVMLQVETVDRVSRPLREAGAGGRPPSQPPRQPRPQLSSKGGPQ